MEFLKNPLAKLLNIILPNTQVNLRGIFFTSASQKDTPFDNLTKTVSRAYEIPHFNIGHRMLPPKSFFINEIFKRIIFPETKFYSENNPVNRLHFMTSLLIILITSICVFFFFNSYKYNHEAINSAQHAIKLAQAHSFSSPLLNQLDILETTMQQLNQKPREWYKRIGMHQANKLKKDVQSIYVNLLKTQFLANLQHNLENQLQNTKEGNTNQLYATLKAYLMLADLKHFDKKFFKDWFDNYWHQAGCELKEAQSLDKHLVALMNFSFKEQTINPQVIENTRSILNNMPQSRLVLTILQNQYQRSPIQITPGIPESLWHGLPRELPGIYDIRNFRNVYYSEIGKTCQEITNGNWVLGKSAQPAFSEIILNQLTSEVKAIYLNEYAVIWSDLLNKIKVDNLQDLNQVLNMITVVNDPQSPLLQLINTIRNNTQPLSDSVEFTQQVSMRFLTLNALSADLLKNTNQSHLLAVKSYLEKLTHTQDLDRACYEAAKNRMENSYVNDPITNLLQQSRILPEPIQTWHTLIAAESWRLILKNTQNFLNSIWIATVCPQYEAMINRRYPIFKDSPTDIPLYNFTTFFGNGGIMDTFFKNYLQPFVDNSKLYWEWKNVDGQRLNIPQPTLEMFIRAALIQKMFFPEDAKLPAITFSLVPVELDTNIQSFSLDLEGQILIFQKDNEQIITLSWPGPQPTHTQVTFLDDQGKKLVLTEAGPWSWFKILNKSRLEPTTNPKHFRLNFETNAGGVHYELYTNGIVNPFIPGILSAFRCPENLY